MRTAERIGALLPAAVVALAVIIPPAHGVIGNATQRRCQEAVGNAGGEFVRAYLKEKAKCADKNLKATGSCDFAKRDEKLDKAETKLRQGLQKKCIDAFPAGFDAQNIAIFGFAGKCFDGDLSDFFTGEDLKDCIVETHRDIVEALFDLEYGANGDDAVIDFETQNPVLARDLRKCQQEIGRSARAFAAVVYVELARCRDRLNEGSLDGVAPADCGDTLLYPRPKERIAAAYSRAIVKIGGRCDDPPLVELDVCDVGSGPEPTVVGAAACLLDSHRVLIESVLDVAYPRSKTAVCGDNLVNEPVLSTGLVAGAR